MTQISDNAAHNVHRNRKADSLREAVVFSLAENRRINAYHLALHVDERPAAVARINRGVSLQKIIIRPADDAAFRADNSGGDGLAESVGIADRNYPLAHANRVGIARRDDRQFSLAGFNLNQRNIGFDIAPNHVGVKFLPVKQRNTNLLRALDDVIIRNNIPVLFKNDAGA